MKIDGAHIILTGGAKGLGHALVTDLAASGATIISLDNDKTAIENCTVESSVTHYLCDITIEEQVKNVFHEIEKKFDKVDILINNAGIIHNELLLNPTKKPIKHSYESWKKTIEINLNGQFLIGSYAAEFMFKSRSNGLIVNISSVSALGNLGQSAYSASKAAIEALTKVWAKELGIYGIRCVAIAPGFIESQSTHSALSEKLLDKVKAKIPSKKLGEIENIVNGVRFVIQNDYVNSRTIRIDGGISI
ncbi:SDR family oxidoreductase [Gammaproteobacteria bacterium]|nr:SDR family oxidoreductase [Gammaproteobacteria bacterium]